ncbi:putative quinol monooxygenase [Allorhizobium sp. NPDC080224]|uniref:putative quinol monooxygenase n=1 Tax=Allorhizobium sp. NPDC080224 TaxID=3390547 RepID=UPI003D017B02
MKRREVMMAIGSVAAMATVGTIGVPANARQAATGIAHGFHARMKARAGQGDALVALLFEAPAFEHADCKVFLVGRSKGEPDVVFVTEGWVSEEAHTRFTATEEAKAYTARFGPLVEEWTSSDEIPVGGKAVLT